MEVVFKLSPKIVNLIAKAERHSGAWDRISRGEKPSRSTSRANVQTLVSLEGSFNEGSQFDRFLPANALSSLESMRSTAAESLPSHIYQQLAAEQEIDEIYRTEKTRLYFQGDGALQLLFPTVQPFLIEQRLQDLLEWLAQELKDGRLHPLLVIGCFHLLLLQISPYARFNHTVALLSVAELLQRSGFTALARRPVASQLLRCRTRYGRSLKQAEKTAASSWATLNVWLEFFLAAIGACVEEAVATELEAADFSLLTPTQQSIVEAVRLLGSATREQIADSSGVNVSTVKYNLGVLLEKKVLQRYGRGRTTNYQVS